MDNVVLFGSGDTYLIHESVIDNQIHSESISRFVGPENCFGNVVDNIAVNDESKTHTGKGIGGLVRVLRRDISITNLAHSVYSPI